MNHAHSFNRLRNRALFISLAGVSAFTTACGSDGHSPGPSDSPGIVDTQGGTGGATSATGAGRGPGSHRPALAAAPGAASHDVVVVKVKPQQVVDASANPAAGLSLPSPSKLATDTTTVPEAMHRDGAAFSATLPNALVTAAGTAAVFAPTVDSRSPSSADVAYAIYRFKAPSFAESGMPQTVRIEWKGDAPLPDAVSVAIARLGADRWDFFAGPDDGVLTIDSFAPYQSEGGELMIAVALASDATSTLAGLTLGEPELRGMGYAATDAPSNAPPASLTTGAPLPASVNLRGLMPGVWSQGQVGSCSGFSTAGLLTYEFDRLYGPYGWNASTSDFNRVSPRWIYNQTPFASGKSCPDDGHSLYDVANFVVANGAATQHNAPIGKTTKSDYDCSTSFYAAAIEDAQVLKPTRYHSFSLRGSTGVQAAKEALAQGEALAFGMHTDSDFKSYDDDDGVWNYSGDGTEEGGHAVVIAGYDDGKQAFYIRNSWGSDWGDRGYVWIGYQSFVDGLMLNRMGDAYYYDVEFNLDAAERLIPSMPFVQPPAHVTVSKGEPALLVTWSKETAAAGYKIYRDDPANLVATVTGAGTTQWTDAGVTDTGTHTYYVSAFAHTSGGDVETRVGSPDTGYKAADPLTKSVAPTSGTAGALVTLNVQVVGTGPFTYAWDFAGGATPSTSADANPTISLGAHGTYKAHVTVTNARGSSTYPFDLVVDAAAPTFLHTYGGTSMDYGTGVFVDGSGSTYVLGGTRSYGAGQDDFQFVKYLAGGARAYAFTWGTSVAETPRGLAGDDAGNVFFVGGTASARSGDIVFGQLDPNGQLSLVETIGGGSFEIGAAVARGPSGEIYVAGSTSSAGAGSTDLYVAKLGASGQVVWQKTLGTTGADAAESLAVSPDGSRVIVTGTTGSTSDVVTASLDAASGSLLWERQWGTTRPDFGSRVATDRDGNVYVSATTHADTLANQDVAVIKYSPAGARLWTVAMTGMSYSSALNSNFGIAVDPMNEVFVVTDYVDDNGQSGLYRHILYKLDSDGRMTWARRSENQPSQTHYANMVMSSGGKLAFVGTATNSATYDWTNLRVNDDFAYWNNPTGMTESAASLSAAAAPLTTAPITGKFSEAAGQVDGTSGSVQALVCTYNPNAI